MNRISFDPPWIPYVAMQLIGLGLALVGSSTDLPALIWIGGVIAGGAIGFRLGHCEPC